MYSDQADDVGGSEPTATVASNTVIFLMIPRLGDFIGNKGFTKFYIHFTWLENWQFVHYNVMCDVFTAFILFSCNTHEMPVSQFHGCP